MSRAIQRGAGVLLACAIAGPCWAADAGNAADPVARGKYLATAGDCVGCHSSSGKPAYSGGTYLSTPFGRLAAPNITADKETGIGTWSEDDFYHALHDGKRKDGSNLYPAMPYVWYTKVTRDDVAAIHAYLASLPPVNAKDKTTEMSFPFDVRAGISAWNALYFKAGEFKPDPSKPASWNRGAYLVEGLGHCAACHTPTNAALAPITSRAFAGGRKDDWYAPNITSDPKDGIGAWSENDIVTYLKKGAAPGKGVVLGPMKEVHQSLSQLTDDDLHAIATYVKSIPAKSDNVTDTSPTERGYLAGADIYLSNCASCHQTNGRGIAHAVPPLAGNGVVTAAGAEDVVRAVAGGLPAQDSYAPMPGFAQELTAQQIADVTNYVRNSWGNKAPANATGGMVDNLVPKTKTMMAANHWCDKPPGAELGQTLTDPSGPVQTTLGQINDVTLYPDVKKLVADVKGKVPNAKRADLVNGLTAAYCPFVFKDKSLQPGQRAPRLDQFAELVYTVTAE